MAPSMTATVAVAAAALLGSSASCRATGFAMHGRSSSFGPPSLLSAPRGLATPPSDSRLLDWTLGATTPRLTTSTSLSAAPSATASASAAATALRVPSGGAIATSGSGSGIAGIISKATASPVALFDSILLVLAAAAVSLKAAEKVSASMNSDDVESSSKANKAAEEEEKPAAVKSLQVRFLTAFWLLRCGYWMSGPYVVPAYASKVSMDLVSKIFLTGFAATAIFGPSVGQATDSFGRKKGTLAFALLYGIGVASIKYDPLWMLFAGRAVVGVALSLLFSAPEAWLNGEAAEKGAQKYLGETFGLAYLGDSLVAIIAGKLAGAAAAARGPTGPFDLSIVFLAAGAVFSGLFWKENFAAKEDVGDTNDKGGEKKTSGIREGFDIVKADPKIMLVGAVQSLFEAAMYVFILQWPPAISGAVNSAFGGDATTPYGTVFSCFMTCSLLGSILFGKLIKSKFLTETTTSAMLAVSALSMGLATFAASMKTVPLAMIVAAMLAFEACVGMYFPAIGTLRSKYVPDSHKSVILNLFGIPLNLLVVIIYLSIKQLGTTGALGVSAGALAVATGCMMKLRSMTKKEAVAA